MLGFPVVEAEDMPDIAANSLSIAFGSFKRGYTSVDRIRMQLLVDPYTNKPYVRLYTYKRSPAAFAVAGLPANT
jgi:HK97 family phage major capsid protein